MLSLADGFLGLGPRRRCRHAHDRAADLPGPSAGDRARLPRVGRPAHRADSILRASEIEERYRLSFWDAVIVAAALAARASKIRSEDLSPGQTIEGILVESPFRPWPRAR